MRPGFSRVRPKPDTTYGFVNGALGIALVVTLTFFGNALAQDTEQPAQNEGADAHSQHDHAHMSSSAQTWAVMQDGTVFAEFNHQGSSRGADEFAVPNWWMGMASRNLGRGKLTLTSMMSLDAAGVGKSGYAEIFQAGETLNRRPLVDRQHPHDFFVQLAAAWRVPLSTSTGLTLAGGPVGEPALGPVAFMHRASAVDNPTAPLSHHVFDSTHVAFGVVTAAVDRGSWTFEGSVFNGREPDEDRWDFDFGRLDSVSARVWFRPTRQWEFQVSTGHLKDPELLEPGNIVRTTASASWTRAAGNDLTAVTVGYGRNDTSHGNRQAVFGEIARKLQPLTLFSRVEVLQVETSVLRDDAIPRPGAESFNWLLALTLGGVRELTRWRGFEVGVGGDATFYAVPDVLKATGVSCLSLGCPPPPGYGAHPVSFHVFTRIGLPAPGGRMWNMRMAQPMNGHSEQAGHVHPR